MKPIYSIKGVADEKPEYENRVYDYKAELLKVYEKSNDLFEKQLSYISAGALGITFVLIEKVIKDFASAKLIGFIIACWILLASSLCVNLASHLYTSRCHYKTIQDINAGLWDNKVADRRNNRINRVNLVSVASLFLGIFCFIIFTSYNIFELKKLSKKDNAGIGAKIIPAVPGSVPHAKTSPAINPGKSLPVVPPSGW